MEMFIVERVAGALKEKARANRETIEISLQQYEELKIRRQGNTDANQRMASKMIEMVLLGLSTNTARHDFEFLFWLASRIEVEEIAKYFQEYRDGRYTVGRSVAMVTEFVDVAVDIFAGVSKRSTEAIHQEMEKARSND